MSSDKKMIILTAPSGSGKTTIARYLLSEIPELQFSVSATNRPKRTNEINGDHYYFFTDEEFQQLITDEKLAEWQAVYPGQYYGTLKSEIHKAWEKNKVLLFDIDVKGALNLKKQYGDKALTLFIKVPDIHTLEKRLKQRGSETERSLEKRLKRARYEYYLEDEFDEVVINENLDRAQEECLEIVLSYLNTIEYHPNA